MFKLNTTNIKRSIDRAYIKYCKGNPKYIVVYHETDMNGIKVCYNDKELEAFVLKCTLNLKGIISIQEA